MPVAVIILVSTLTLIIVSLLTKPPSSETIDRYFNT